MPIKISPCCRSVEARVAFDGQLHVSGKQYAVDAVANLFEDATQQGRRVFVVPAAIHQRLHRVATVPIGPSSHAVARLLQWLDERDGEVRALWGREPEQPLTSSVRRPT